MRRCLLLAFVMAGGCRDGHHQNLSAHEAQFWIMACGDHFIVGVPQSLAVVVGTDIVASGTVYPGAHDCTLGQDMRYIIEWGDGDIATCRLTRPATRL